MRDSHYKSNRYHRLRLLEVNLVSIEGCPSSDKHTQPAECEANVGVQMNLFEQLRT